MRDLAELDERVTMGMRSGGLFDVWDMGVV